MTARLHVERHAADHAVAVDDHVDVAQAGGGTGQIGRRFADLPGGAVLAGGLDQQGQVNVARAGQGGGQGGVAGFGLGEQDVIGHGAGLGLGQTVDQGGVDRPRPGPAAERVQTAVVDGDNDDRRVGGAVL